MKPYVVLKDGVLILVEANGFVPEGAVGLLPSGQDIRWMKYESSVLSVDSALKSTIENQDSDEAIESAKSTSIISEYLILNSTLTAELNAKFFSLSAESAIANYLEMMDMKANPSLYSGEGLMAEVDVKESDLITKVIDKGEALDTDQKCLDYSTRLLEIARDYLISRHKKKDDFRAYKDSL